MLYYLLVSKLISNLLLISSKHDKFIRVLVNEDVSLY